MPIYLQYNLLRGEIQPVKTVIELRLEVIASAGRSVCDGLKSVGDCSAGSIRRRRQRRRRRQISRQLEVLVACQHVRYAVVRHAHVSRHCLSVRQSVARRRISIQPLVNASPPIMETLRAAAGGVRLPARRLMQTPCAPECNNAPAPASINQASRPPTVRHCPPTGLPDSRVRDLSAGQVPCPSPDSAHCAAASQ